MNKVSWGVLSTAKIALERVIAPMQKAANLSIDAIASRDAAKASAIAAQFGISKSYGSYEKLLSDLPLRPFTFRSPTTCTSNGQSAQRSPENMCSLRSRWL